jgi:hypothetical protein
VRVHASTTIARAPQRRACDASGRA